MNTIEQIFQDIKTKTLLEILTINEQKKIFELPQHYWDAIGGPECYLKCKFDAVAELQKPNLLLDILKANKAPISAVIYILYHSAILSSNEQVNNTEGAKKALEQVKNLLKREIVYQSNDNQRRLQKIQFTIEAVLMLLRQDNAGQDYYTELVVNFQNYQGWDLNRGRNSLYQIMCRYRGSREEVLGIISEYNNCDHDRKFVPHIVVKEKNDSLLERLYGYCCIPKLLLNEHDKSIIDKITVDTTREVPSSVSEKQYYLAYWLRYERNMQQPSLERAGHSRQSETITQYPDELPIQERLTAILEIEQPYKGASTSNTSYPVITTPDILNLVEKLTAKSPINPIEKQTVAETLPFSSIKNISYPITTIPPAIQNIADGLMKNPIITSRTQNIEEEQQPSTSAQDILSRKRIASKIMYEMVDLALELASAKALYAISSLQKSPASTSQTQQTVAETLSSSISKVTKKRSEKGTLHFEGDVTSQAKRSKPDTTVTNGNGKQSAINIDEIFKGTAQEDLDEIMGEISDDEKMQNIVCRLEKFMQSPSPQGKWGEFSKSPSTVEAGSEEQARAKTMQR